MILHFAESSADIIVSYIDCCIGIKRLTKSNLTKTLDSIDNTTDSKE